ncbi:Phage tail-collar fibre protein [Pseudomonas antarctica]|uniref:Phage tail-collar fibre protein n=1 Tax=Pseudomonas antarctica TaxID=219572 RepID=A0A1H0BDJ3_9PSED|nr:hypothetical protein PSAN_45880 [Pseudomonas antarctica]SDN43719.1 Phage tail-collar fibre protein [Pseudomonas antarctica]
MIDQNSQFFAILTAVGEAKQANATALGLSWTFSQMGVGDANGTDPIPNRAQTKLINEWRRAPLNQVRPDPANPNIIITEQVIPPDVGGRWIRELALYDADGDMVAVANCAPSFKALLAQGTGKTQVIRMNFIVASTANIVLKIDPSVVLATREYVDLQIIEALAKLDFKHSVLVATTANIVLSGIQTVDGVLLPADARVLVKDQTQAKENGIYVVPAGGAWRRAQDADASVEVTPGLFVSVEKGTAHGDSVWQLVTDAPINLGTTALTFEAVAGRTGVLAGTYRSLTVDKNGRVIAGTNPTTLSGYGITDAFTKPEATSAIQQAISGLVNSSPAALDTLSELATALGNDPNFATSVTNALAGKAGKATTLGGYGITDAFTKPEATSAIQQAISAVVNSSPAALDTLSELATALGNDPNFATSVTNALAGKAGKATTLGGYGIADAYTKSEVNSSLEQFIKGGQSLPAYSNLSFSSNNAGMISTIVGNTGSVMVDNGGNKDASAVIAFHRVGAFAAYIGLDTDNQWKVGGWSMGAAAHVLWHAGNFNPASKINGDRCNNVGFTGGGDVTTDPYMQHLNGSVAYLATKAYSVLGFQIVKGDTGYIKLPDFLGGFILQWTKTPTLSTNTTYTWNFPLGFPAKCAGVIGTQIGTSQGPIEVSIAPSQASVGLAIGIQTAAVGPAFVWAWGW